jgi:hypothetical protein
MNIVFFISVLLLIGITLYKWRMLNREKDEIGKGI